MQLEKATLRIFSHLEDVINKISADDFIHPLEILHGATIGQHIRHSIEMFICLHNGYDTGQVNYDKRKRDKDLEQNKSEALKTLITLQKNINRPDKPLIISNSIELTESPEYYSTTYYRELAYCLEHAVHHMTIIKIGLNVLAPTLQLPEGFGVAVSTLKYQKMCTVTYLPLKDGFIITSNRDERLLRKPATAPQLHNKNGVELLFPQDTEAGGTWIATTATGRTVCLLNGAFEAHIPNPPYRKSRGLVVLDFFQTQSVEEFKAYHGLQGIEPFTMVIAEQKKLYELRWDGSTKYLKQLDESQPNIHSSSTLYTKETMALRELWFTQWLSKHPDYYVKDILNFHLFAGEGDEASNIRMSRYGIVETLSVTSIQVKNNKPEMYYADLKNKENADFSAYAFKQDEIKSDNFIIASNRI